MATVTFEIAPSYVDTFKKYRNIKGGCVVPAKRIDTGELGALLICHSPSLDKWEHFIDKVKWIVSCRCPYEDKSPFGPGSSEFSVETIFSKGLLQVTLDGIENTEDVEFLHLSPEACYFSFKTIESLPSGAIHIGQSNITINFAGSTRLYQVYKLRRERWENDIYYIVDANGDIKFKEDDCEYDRLFE